MRPGHQKGPQEETGKPGAIIAQTKKGRGVSFMEDVAVSEENRKTGKLVAMAMVKSVRQLASTLIVAA